MIMLVLADLEIYLLLADLVDQYGTITCCVPELETDLQQSVSNMIINSSFPPKKIPTTC